MIYLPFLNGDWWSVMITTSGSNGTLLKGGDGGSALSNIPYTSLITGSSYQVGQGGTGAGSNTTPVVKSIPVS